MPGIAERRSSVQIQALTETRDSYGQPLQSWTTVATLRALIRSPNGREMLNAQQRKAVLWHVIECRWPGSLVAITPNMRVKFGGIQYGISDVINVNQKNRHLIIHCTEQVAPAKAL